MVRIRRFGIVRTANMVAALYAFIALIFLAFFAPVRAARAVRRDGRGADGSPAAAWSGPASSGS